LIAGEVPGHRLVRGAEHFAGDGGGGHEWLHQVGDVGEMLERGVGVAVAFKHAEARS